MHRITWLLLLIIISIANGLYAQPLTQVLRGIVVDKQVKTALAGATVMLMPTDPVRGAYTDASGLFRFDAVPVGSYTVTVTYLGYKPVVVANVVVNSGKETVLSIELEEAVAQINKVVITADQRKDKPVNEMSSVSTRTFSVEEAKHYAAAVEDPARMAMAYAGVVAPDDGNNRIVIRGNAPNGLLWRMEGIDIPNPNHFSDVGTAGGGISILSSNLLTNSDFSTGAFASEYGNALSGVFDLKLRKGNDENREYTVKAGFLGLGLATEGPFAKNYNGSYLVNYRYSTLDILNRLKLLDDPYHTNFQDLAYHLYLPTKRLGYFTLFGFGGLSDQRYTIPKDSSNWESSGDRYGGKFLANTGATGITHGFIFNSKAYLKTSLAMSATGNGYDTEFMNNEYGIDLLARHNHLQYKATLQSVLNYKFSSKASLRSGLVHTRWSFGLLARAADNPGETLITHIDETNATQLSQAFSQVQLKPTDRLTFNGGLHLLYLWLNETHSIEPRASVQWDFSHTQSIALGYGLHGQTQPIGTYFSQRIRENGNVEKPNRSLGFTKAHHFVLSHNISPANNLRIKTEFYAQRLFNVPVMRDTLSSFSMINQADGFVTDALVNDGVGRNNGVEITVERFMTRRAYFLLSMSLYDSKYRGSDGVERNSRYNGGYAGTFTGGKEFLLSKKGENTVLGLNAKLMNAGGFRRTPILLDQSIEAGYGVFDDTQAYALKNPYYFRADLGISLKLNRPRLTSIFSLDVQNVTNRNNIQGQYYEPLKQELVTYYHVGLIPLLGYTLQF